MLHPVPFSLSPADRARALIGQAVELWTHGHPIAAAMLSRAALETHLRHLSEARPCWPCYVCAMRLLKTGVIDRQGYHELANLFRIGNHAAHARPVTFAAIKQLLCGARMFITSTERAPTPPITIGAVQQPLHETYMSIATSTRRA
jgi:hypothetical protein